MSLYNAEGHSDQLYSNLGKTSRTIFIMYFTYLLIGTFAYKCFGMSLFDAINHDMCALSTRGLSTKFDSIGAYSSIPIEVITIFLMIIGTTNFAVLLLLSKIKIKQFCKVRLYGINIQYSIYIINKCIFCSKLFRMANFQYRNNDITYDYWRKNWINTRRDETY